MGDSSCKLLVFAPFGVGKRMSLSDKRLVLRFGAFACSVQGFEDPVQPVQQILRAIQHLLEESPELSDTAINFDAEAIEQLVGEVARRAEIDEHEVEIVPGLVIIHHGAGGDLGGEVQSDAAHGSDWSAAFGAAEAPAAMDDRDPTLWQGDGSEGAEGEHATGGYVNIFAGDGESAGEETARETGQEMGADDEEDLVARLRRVAEAGDADYGWDEADDTEAGGDSAQGSDWQDETWPEEASEPEARAAEPANFFAAGEAAPAGAEDPAPGRNLFTVVDNEAEDETDWRNMLADAGSGAGEQSPETDEAASEAAEQSYTAAGLAERAGAQAVPDLMVAAAAWMVLIKGQTQFTRREVLDVFDTIPGEHEKTPESRIKGFGKAVRNGHLVMIEEGVFGIARSDLERFQSLL